MPANLDPRIGTDAQSQRLHSLLFSALLERDAEMNLRGDLAERWDSPDPLTYVFHLRRNIRFHDGRPLTSADVKFTFDSILSGELKTPKRGAFRMVESVSAPDAFTVVFRLREPFASFLWNLTRPSVGIVPAGSGADFASQPIGSGPFRFVRARQDEEVVLERNSAYFRNGPEEPAAAQAKLVKFRIVPEATVRALELQKGTADLALNSLAPDMVPVLARDPNLAVTQQPGTTYVYVAFNFDDTILARREVRQALAFATDRPALLTHLLRGQAHVADSLLPPNHWAYSPAPPESSYVYSPARAERLLDAAGFPRRADGTRLRLTMKTSTEETSRLIGAVLQQQWARVGVALDLRPYEFATLYSDITRGTFQLYTLRWIGANNDPDIFEYVFHSRKFPPDGANRGHYRNPQLDSLLDQARIEPDRETRRRLYAQVQRIVAEDLPYLNLWYLDNVCLHRRALSNVRLTPAGDYDFVADILLR
jgi:peptide/nickel transport system substrate-binding protein